MLKLLTIKDFALIESISIEFGKGLNIITGETGAGKSIILDAFSLILGERASADMVRKGAQKSVVEAFFDISGNTRIKNFLDENEIEYEDELIVRREISQKSSSRCFLNDTPTTITLLKIAGDYLVDLHGQHEHQSLLQTENHIDLLDEFGNLKVLLEDFFEVYSKFNASVIEMKALKENEQLIKEKKDFYSFQLKEIHEIAPLEDEDIHLNEELNVLENSEKLLEVASDVYDKLYESGDSVIDKLGIIKEGLHHINKIDQTTDELVSTIESVLDTVKELSKSVLRYKDKIDLDPETLENKRNRLFSINNLKRKYSKTLKEIIDYRIKIEQEISIVENFTEQLENLSNEINKYRKISSDRATILSKERSKIAKTIEKNVEEILAFLGMPNSKFNIIIKKNETENNDIYLNDNNTKLKVTSKGIDEVEFYIATNHGEDLKPLSKVASGGEVSRIMLALKTILAKTDKLPILVFDEIDTGISGRIAQKVGTTLKDLGKYHQIISITHLPQIAGFADFHFLVEKTQENNRTHSQIRKLTEDEHVFEIAKMLSGENITDSAIESAKALIKGE